jgi:hypothetical protein
VLAVKARTIDRRTLWKSPLFGALLAMTWPKSAASAVRHSVAPAAARSLRVSARLVSEVARTFFDYVVPNEDAERIARSANSTVGAWRNIAALNLAPVDPFFSYSALLAEAELLAEGQTDREKR